MLPPTYDRDVHHLISKVSHMCRPNKISVHSNFSSDFTVFSSGRGRERNSASSSHNLNRLIGANLRLSICSQKKTRESKRRNAFGGKMIGYSKIRKKTDNESDMLMIRGFGEIHLKADIFLPELAFDDL